MSSISNAIELCKNNKFSKEFEKGISIFRAIVLNRVMTESTRIKALKELSRIAEDEAIDIITRIRDAISFLKDEELETEIKFISSLVEHPFISSHERVICALVLYNNHYIELCYDLFTRLASDISLLVEYRVESTRYLVYSEVKNHIKTAKKNLIEIISSEQYTSDYRYKAIASFISINGLVTFLNLERLNVKYNEKFVSELQKTFFRESKNDIRYRILSGQHLLSMNPKRVPVEEKTAIITEFLKIGTDYSIIYVPENGLTPEEHDENIMNVRADALDVVMRMALTEEQKQEANKIMNNLGFSLVNGKKINDLSHKAKTVYTDRQNVHNDTIQKSVTEFINKFFKDPENKRSELESYQQVHTEVSELAYEKLSSSERVKCFKSLNRISIDTATFTEKKVTTAEIFVYVWKLVSRHDAVTQELLKKRMLEELVDICDTCSTGVANRCLNVLQGYDVNIKISFRDQIIANMSARMQAKIRHMEDYDLQSQVILGMMETAEPIDKNAFLTFIGNNTSALRDELFLEFVKEGYITDEEFENIFQEGVHMWV